MLLAPPSSSVAESEIGRPGLDRRTPTRTCGDPGAWPPPVNGLVVTVKDGDTLDSLATRSRDLPNGDRRRHQKHERQACHRQPSGNAGVAAGPLQQGRAATGQSVGRVPEAPLRRA